MSATKGSVGLCGREHDGPQLMRKALGGRDKHSINTRYRVREPTGAAGEPWSVVKRLNAAWLGNQVDLLPPLFHEDALIVDGTHQVLAIGRDACVASYRDFITSATVQAYTEEAPAVDLFGSTAVVSYPFTIRYSTGGQTYTEAGSDCLVLARSGGEWEVVWRQLVWRAA